MKSLLLATLLLCGSLLAHDAKLHKGNATEGEILSVTPTTMVVKTAKGNVTAKIEKTTKLEMGDQAVAISHFKKGDKVSVFGTKLASGELVATEIVMPGATSDHKH